jgi:hypothetical protein
MTDSSFSNFLFRASCLLAVAMAGLTFWLLLLGPALTLKVFAIVAIVGFVVGFFQGLYEEY